MTEPSASIVLPVFRAQLQPDWIDYNGHLRDASYSLIMSYAIDDVMDHLGLDATYRERTKCTLYTLELHLHFLHEVKSSDDLTVASSILASDSKRIHMGCRFTCSRLSGAAAVGEVILLHVHQGETPVSHVFPDSIADRLESLKDPGTADAAWEPSSRKMGLTRRKAPVDSP